MVLRRSTLDDIMTTKPNQTKPHHQAAFFSSAGEGVLAKKLSEEKVMAVPFHAFVVFSMLF